MKLTIMQSGLDFGEALKALKDRKLIKVPEWDGYWFLQGGQIKVQEYNGQTSTTPYYQPHIFRNDWQVVEKGEKKPKGQVYGWEQSAKAKP